MFTFTGVSASSTKFLSQTVLALTVAGLISAQPAFAQSNGFASSGAEGAVAAPSPTPTTTKAATKRRAKAEREPSVPFDKKFSVKVTSGMLTIDGLVAKVQLNYDIHHAGYLYFFMPGEGTVVVSRAKMPDAVRVPDAIQGLTVAFSIDGHHFELTSETPLVGGLHEEHDAYVWLDRNSTELSQTPQFGFGNTLRAPYKWPLSAAEGKDLYAHFVEPPPMPLNLLPKTKATLVAASEAKP